MGSDVSSLSLIHQFKKSVAKGDESTALRIILNFPHLHNQFDPNQTYGDLFDLNTPLHFAALYGMPNVLRILLNDFNGNPNKLNVRYETALHLACTPIADDRADWMERSRQCVLLLLEWRGTNVQGKELKIDLSMRDNNGNTALHLAANWGLADCVKDLVHAGSSVFIGNNQNYTPRHIALIRGHYQIALLLEAKMFCNNTLELDEEEKLNMKLAEDDEKFYSFNFDEILNLNDSLCGGQVEESLKLIRKAEVLLRTNEAKLSFISDSYRKKLIDIWVNDLDFCFQLAGIGPYQPMIRQEVRATKKSVSKSSADGQFLICLVCMLTIEATSETSIQMVCYHYICIPCWKAYLLEKINGRESLILCPAYDCETGVPEELIKSMVSPDVFRKYRFNKFQNFMVTGNFIKWCPEPGCGLAVRLLESEFWQPLNAFLQEKGLTPSRAVECGNGHAFCWDCRNNLSHAPSACSQWRKWKKLVCELMSEKATKDIREMQELDTQVWLAYNSKRCPKCQIPIQKDLGCNVMRCLQCKFEFCWLCMSSWMEHASNIGGDLGCTAYTEIARADRRQAVKIRQAVEKSNKKDDLRRFVLYHTIYQKHESLLDRDRERLLPLFRRMEAYENVLLEDEGEPAEKVKEQVSCLTDGMQEVLMARRTISGSCVYGYYLEENGYNMASLFFHQRELEEYTDKLSGLLVRPSLRTSRGAIIRSMIKCRRKRYGFMQILIKELATQASHVIFKKTEQKLPKQIPGCENKDDKKENNSSSVSSAETKMRKVKKIRRTYNKYSIYSWLDFILDSDKANRAISDSEAGLCSVRGCQRPKEKNLETQKLYHYCSKCMRNYVQRTGLDKRPWKNLKIWRKKSHATVERVKKAKARYLAKPWTRPYVTHTPQDVKEIEAIALSMQQQKIDVGVTIGNVTPKGTDAERSAHHSKPEQSEDELCAKPGGLEATSSIKKSKEQLVSSPRANTYLIFDINEKKAETKVSLKPIEKPGSSAL